MGSKGAGFFAFLLGAGVGTALGILYAPDKGINTRDKLSFQLDKYKKKLMAVLDDLGEEEKILSKNPKSSKSADMVSETKNKAEKLLEDVDQLINKIRTQEQ